MSTDHCLLHQAGAASSEAIEGAPSRPKVSKGVQAAVLAAVIDQARADQDVLVNKPSEILDYLFLGDCDNASNMQQLQHFGITHIVNITTNDQLGVQEGLCRLFLSLDDHDEENIAVYFSPACDFIEKARTAGGCVLVHCMAGRSRSASLVLAYLMRHRGMNLSDAFFFLKQKRPIVLPNIGFWEQLMTEELRYHGSQSPVPANYQAVYAARQRRDQISPSSIFKRYLDLFALLEDSHFADEQQRLLEEWPEGWPVAKSVHEILLCCVEHIPRKQCDTKKVEQPHHNSRTAAVKLIAKLVDIGRFTDREVKEGISQFRDMDFEDLRLDNPKIDEYVVEVMQELELLGLTTSTGRSV